nr:hypothetical protein [uncultured Oscillibacter sp.]
MAKQYYIKKNPSSCGADIEWMAVNGKEFYRLITSSAGKGRYFIDMDDFMIEATEADYTKWRKEKNIAIICACRKLKALLYLSTATWLQRAETVRK